MKLIDDLLQMQRRVRHAREVLLRIEKAISELNELDEIKALQTVNPESEILGQLTKTEKKIFQVLRQDKSRADLAKSLGIAEKTFDTHRDNMRKKFGLKNWDELKKLSERLTKET